MMISKYLPRLLRTLCLTAALWLSATHLMAQAKDHPGKEVENAQMVAIGATDVLDTYLAPWKYKGAEMRYISHTLRHEEGKKWMHRIVHTGTASFTEDRSGDGSMSGGYYNLNVATLRPLTASKGNFTFMVGGQADFNIGALYNARNQNNPAQLKLVMSIGPTVNAQYRFHLKKTRIRLGYELDAPLVGLMFCPNYGQSYYEIFSLGNYDHNAIVTTPFSAPSMRHTVTLDAELWGTIFRLGYLGDYQQAEVNNIKQHAYTHALLIGVVRHFTIHKKHL